MENYPNYKEVLSKCDITDVTVLSDRTQAKINEFVKLETNNQPAKLKEKKLLDLNQSIVRGIADYVAKQNFLAEEASKKAKEAGDPPPPPPINEPKKGGFSLLKIFDED